MNINNLPIEIRNCLEAGISELSINQEMIGFWEVSDYGIFVLLTETFYKNLNYRKADPEDFYSRLLINKLPWRDNYPDSRQYICKILNHFDSQKLTPHIIDVGGYIGRFSLEAAIYIKNYKSNIPIHCLEPGLTRNIIKANLAINGVSDFVSLRSEAASNSNGTTTYNYSPNILISGRICSFPTATQHKIVITKRLDTLLSEVNCREAAIIKIDTEGHEPCVMEGLGDLVHTIPMVCIVEFWPRTLNKIVNQVPYWEYIQNNFHTININSSLYPKNYNLITNIIKFAENINSKEGNIDLLFISKKIHNVERLIKDLIN